MPRAAAFVGTRGASLHFVKTGSAEAGQTARALGKEPGRGWSCYLAALQVSMGSDTNAVSRNQ